MARQLTLQQDLFSHLVDGHSIRAGNGQDVSKIAIERLELHLGDPAGVRLTQSSVHALSTVRRRSPTYLLPPRPEAFVDRSAELETLRQSVMARHVVDLHGPDGVGKSTLAAALAHGIDLNRFPDGVVFVAGKFLYQDLLQGLFDSFYTSDTPIKITPDYAHTYLSNLRLMVILDNAGLSPKQIDPILNVLGESAVLVVGAERTALGRGRALKLQGLPRQAAVELFKQATTTTPGPEDGPLVEQICLLLNDVPLSVAGVAAQTAHSQKTLTQILTELQSRRPWAAPGGDLSIGPSLEQIILALDATERGLLTLIAAFSGPGASSEALRWMTSLSARDFQERVSRLQELRLIESVYPQSISSSRSQTIVPQRLALISAFAETVRTWLVDDAAREKVVQYYATRLNRGDRLLADELAGLMGAIEDCAQYGWLDHLQPLVNAADHGLAELRWWAEWQHLLDLTRRAAQARSDRSLEAWAMHQMGSMLGVLGEFDRSTHLLRTALGIRETQGDTAGADVTIQNIRVVEHLMPEVVVDQPLPVPENEDIEEELEEPPEFQREGSEEVTHTSRRRRVGLGLLTVSTLLLLSIVGVWYINDLRQSQNKASSLTVAWEFVDAWNALDTESWTQQLKIVVEGKDGEFRYSVNDESVDEMFEVVLPLCSGAEGTIRVESSDGRGGSVDYAFDSPFCR